MIQSTSALRSCADTVEKLTITTLAPLAFKWLAALIRVCADSIDTLNAECDRVNEHRRRAEKARQRAAEYAQATRWLRGRIAFLEAELSRRDAREAKRVDAQVRRARRIFPWV